ncbi:6,7-dimethyl-8-ribityllumazine synthase [Desulfovibrio sp. UCD-KL4C]|uniref:6,7-dimethyl-8-ribityllumazine synthase n=1 Tax=Desulfovibrio sp. UCD-KL4C TaxID=2578120 RepID=UPI0025C1DF5C|nr:6,7-dimethyl-8-ribityllumazine synthase [Desulfovibrio sp. UCD-KL4C]
MHHINTIEGQLDAKNLKIALIAGRFNDFIVDRLIGGAVDYLVRHGCSKENITLIKVPGAFELPVVTKKVAETKTFNGIVCLGTVIRGATPHFDFVSNECAKGVAQVSLDNNLPIGFGVLTCDTLEQAIERAGSKGGNKGVEAASAMLETIRVLEQI